MKKYLLSIALCAVAFAAMATDHYWIGPATGGRWSNKNNWSSKSVPNRNLDACYFTNNVTIITDYVSYMSTLYFQKGCHVTFLGDETLGTTNGVRVKNGMNFSGGSSLTVDGAWFKYEKTWGSSPRLILTNNCVFVGYNNSISWPENSYVEINGGTTYQNFRIDGSGTNCTFRFRNGANVTSTATFGNMRTNTTILVEGGSSLTHGGFYGTGYGIYGGSMIVREGSTLNLTGRCCLHKSGGNLVSVEGGSTLTVSGDFLTGFGTVVSNDNSTIRLSTLKMAQSSPVVSGEQFYFAGEDAQTIVSGSVEFNNNANASAGATFHFAVPKLGFRDAPFRATSTSALLFGNPTNIKPNGVNEKFVHVNILASSPALDPAYQYATLSKLFFTAKGLQKIAFLDCQVEGADNQAAFAFTEADGETETATAANVRFLTARMENGAGGKPLATQGVEESMGVADTSTLSVSRRTYTFASAVTQLADSPFETYAVLYAGETSSSMVPVATNAITTAGDFSMTWTGPVFLKTYYLRVALETRTAGGEVTHVEWSTTRSAATKDTTNYTWRDVDGDWTGDWGDNAHWSDNKNGDCLGHPATTDANVTIPGGHEIVINLDAPYTIGYFYANSANTCLTLTAPSGFRDTNKLTVKEDSYHNSSTFGGANDTIVLDGCNVSFWYTAFNLGHHSSLILTNAARAEIRQVRVSHAGAAGVWFHAAGGSYATMPIGPGVVLGYSTGSDPSGIVIDNSTVNCGPQLQLHSGAGAVSCGSVSFRGANPVLSVTSNDGKSIFSSTTTDNEHHFIFEVPEDGFTAPPVQCPTTSGNAAFSLDAGTAKLNVVFEVADGSGVYDPAHPTDLPLMTSACGINRDCVSFAPLRHVGRGNTFLYGTANASPYSWAPAAGFSGTAKAIGLRVFPLPHTVIMVR